MTASDAGPERPTEGEVRTLRAKMEALKGLPEADRRAFLAGMIEAEQDPEMRSLLQLTGDLMRAQEKHGASKERKKDLPRLVAIGSGIVFVAAILVIALAIPNPTLFQYTVFRIVLALAAAAFAANFDGFLNVQFAKWLRATGGFAVFVVVYFFVPAALEEPAQSATAAPAAGVDATRPDSIAPR